MLSRATRVVAAFVLCLVASPALAREPSAAADAFDEGIGHYRRKAYSDAAEAFLRAYRLEPSADAAYNAGLAWQLAGKSALAATAYQVALTRGLEPAAATDARARIEGLAPELGRVEVSAPEGALVRVPPFLLEANHAVFFLEPGRHEVRVTLRGGARRARRVDAEAGRTSVLLVEETDREHPSSPATKPRADIEPPSSSSAATTAGWVAVGAGAAIAGVAVFLGVQALDARDEYNASGHRDAAARARAARLRTYTNVAWGVAGVVGAAGVGLLVFAPSAPSTGAAALPRGVAVRGRF